MSYLDEILQSAQGGKLVANLAQRFGLTDEQMDGAIKALAPALEAGLSNAAEEPRLFERLLGDIASPARLAAFEEPGAAHDLDSVAQSRQLLDDLFGSPAATGQVVQAAARESGLQPDILSQLLPVLASVLIGCLFFSFFSHLRLCQFRFPFDSEMRISFQRTMAVSARARPCS